MSYIENMTDQELCDEYRKNMRRSVYALITAGMALITFVALIAFYMQPTLCFFALLAVVTSWIRHLVHKNVAEEAATEALNRKWSSVFETNLKCKSIISETSQKLREGVEQS